MIFKTFTNRHMCNLPCQLVKGPCIYDIPTADGHYEDPKGIKSLTSTGVICHASYSGRTMHTIFQQPMDTMKIPRA